MFKVKPDLMLTLTPKGGLLGILTSFILSVKNRIHLAKIIRNIRNMKNVHRISRDKA